MCMYVYMHYICVYVLCICFIYMCYIYMYLNSRLTFKVDETR